jgi:hypothetical protein
VCPARPGCPSIEQWAQYDATDDKPVAAAKDSRSTAGSGGGDAITARRVSAMGSTVLLAHQGGWDEMLLVAGPIAFVVFLVRLARKRAEAKLAAAEQPDPAPETLSKGEHESP